MTNKTANKLDKFLLIVESDLMRVRHEIERDIELSKAVSAEKTYSLETLHFWRTETRDDIFFEMGKMPRKLS